MKFSIIPMELLWKILEYVEILNLFPFFRVNKDFYTLSNTKEFWVEIHKIHFPNDEIPNSVEKLGNTKKKKKKKKRNEPEVILIKEKIRTLLHPLKKFTKVWPEGEYIKIAVQGMGGVGKSSFIIRFIKDFFDEFEEYIPTIEDSFSYEYRIADESFMLEILDSYEDDCYYGLRETNTMDYHAFILMYSITEKITLEEINDHFIKRMKRILKESRVPLIIVGSKSDLEDEREIEEQEGREIAKTHNAEFIEISSKTGNNVKKVMDLIVRRMMYLVGTSDLEDLPRGIQNTFKMKEKDYWEEDYDKETNKCCEVM